MSRPRVAYLSCSTTMPGSPARREDAYEHDISIGICGQGLHYAGRTLEPVQWDARAVDWSAYEAAIIGTTWDYAQRLPDFLTTLDAINQQTPVLNPPALVGWNARKTYLRDLAARGCPIIPTLWPDTADRDSCTAGFEAFATDRLVIKPQVGAGAWRQVLLGRTDSWPSPDQLPDGHTMVQPFYASVAMEGVYSLLFFNREFSHAVVKRPAAGDYRVQSSYGGADSPWSPSASDLAAAQQVVDMVDGPLLYARVDMIRSTAGQLVLIELEAIEPYLYPLHAPHMAAGFAAAYQALI